MSQNNPLQKKPISSLLHRIVHRTVFTVYMIWNCINTVLPYNDTVPYNRIFVHRTVHRTGTTQLRVYIYNQVVLPLKTRLHHSLKQILIRNENHANDSFHANSMPMYLNSICIRGHYLSKSPNMLISALQGQLLTHYLIKLDPI